MNFLRCAHRATLALVVFLSACSVVDPYPVEWGALETAPGASCHALSGRFASLGQTVKGEKVALDRLFVPDAPRDQVARAVRLQWAEDPALLLVFEFDGQPPQTHRMDVSSSLRCEDGWLVFHRSQWVNREGVVGNMQNTLRMRKGADGHLQVESTGTAVAVMLMIPVVGNTATWYRFPALP